MNILSITKNKGQVMTHPLDCSLAKYGGYFQLVQAFGAVFFYIFSATSLCFSAYCVRVVRCRLS